MERKYGGTEYMPLARSALTMLFSLGKAYTRQGARGVSPRVGGRRGLYREVKRARIVEAMARLPAPMAMSERRPNRS